MTEGASMRKNKMGVWISYEPSPFVAQCNRCLRKTVSANEIGKEDRMTQPDGNPCGGFFERKAGL
jgi:hypothetical protein